MRRIISVRPRQSSDYGVDLHIPDTSCYLRRAAVRFYGRVLPDWSNATLHLYSGTHGYDNNGEMLLYNSSTEGSVIRKTKLFCIHN
jgi:hypothetical protein